MSDEEKLPSEEELAVLPKWSIAVYAIRCALRVQPLLTKLTLKGMLMDKSYEQFKKNKKAIATLDHQYRVLVYTTRAGLTGDATDAATSIVDASETLKFTISSSDSARFAANAGSNASQVITKATNSDLFAARAARAATEASYSAAPSDTAGKEHATGVAVAAREDYARLLELKTEVTDASETGPLGDLWHGSPPDWYVEEKSIYDETITEWEREIAEEEGGVLQLEEQDILSVYIDPGDAPAELITDLYIALDAVYRAHGGSGLEIVKEERRSMIGEPV